MELLLDQFHDRLRTASLHQAFHNIAHFMSWESFPDGFYAPAFLDPASMQAHESWAPEKLKAWFQYPVEKYADAVGLVKKLISKIRQMQQKSKHASVTLCVR